jgi:hypothetical protein
MTNFTSDIDRAAAGYSPDRVDALVWAFSELLVRPMNGEGIYELYRRRNRWSIHFCFWGQRKWCFFFTGDRGFESTFLLDDAAAPIPLDEFRGELGEEAEHVVDHQDLPVGHHDWNATSTPWLFSLRERPPAEDHHPAC